MKDGDKTPDVKVRRIRDMLKLDFIGKNVLVVGGGRGIGKACALN